MALDAVAAVEAIYRTDWGRIVATLIRLVGDFDLAEESAQEAFAAAVEQWPASGVPDLPRAWIIDQLASISELENYRLLHAARADLLRRLGLALEASVGYERALALATTESERRFLQRLLREVQASVS